ncbi:hypothetical protein EVAR_43152_1 [Eumeta japonica]|uniref:Nuclease HARBI1 n=1 Tax=Eumeta variegata TaxID=151549 RepID=A0A4C1XQ96_EUMVA|nr:hypothetical protein EVAR_43152_1 [Eumeta japonica]
MAKSRRRWEVVQDEASKTREGESRYGVRESAGEKEKGIELGNTIKVEMMSVASFDFLYDCVENGLKPSEDAIRYCISPKEKLIVTLRYLASGSLLAELQYGYKIGKSTLSAIIQQVCQVLWRNLRAMVMNPPTTDMWIQISKEFANKAYFTNCIGALDGKHRLHQQQPAAGCEATSTVTEFISEYKKAFTFFEVNHDTHSTTDIVVSGINHLSTSGGPLTPILNISRFNVLYEAWIK